MKKSNKNHLKCVKEMQKIPEDIKMACLRRYLAACKLKNSNAFSLWRQKFGPNRFDKDIISNIIKNIKFIKLKNLIKR